MKHILLVDDVSTNLKCEDMILRDQYEITMVHDGKEAVEFLQTTLPDLILLDIHMKGMNGYEVMEWMKKNPDTAKIPVIILTADTSKECEEKAIACGAADYLYKPAEPEHLHERIKKVLRMKEA